MVLNFDTYSLSILVTDATYVTFGIINDLTNIILPTIVMLLSQLADDTTVFVQSKKEISIALNIIETFDSFSGLILNRNKTEGR
jgi:hypothetical protein